MSVYSENLLNKSNANESWSKIYDMVVEGSRVLDIGCSSGQLGMALRKEKKAYVVGLDLDAADIKLAKKNLDEAHVFDIENDDLSKFDGFDYIIMADVIEHLLDPVKTLKRIQGLLKPGGSLLFSIPNMANATIRIELLKGHFEYRDWGLLDKTHLHFYDTNEVNRVFRQAGYEVATTDCTIRNIPHDILKKELEPIGIEVTDKLEKHLSSPDALTYQFVGEAKVSAAPAAFVPQTSSSLDSVTREIDAVRDELKQKEAEIAELNVRLKHEHDRAVELQTALNEILTSKSWKTLEKAHGTLHKLKRKKS